MDKSSVIPKTTTSISSKKACSWTSNKDLCDKILDCFLCVTETRMEGSLSPLELPFTVNFYPDEN